MRDSLFGCCRRTRQTSHRTQGQVLSWLRVCGKTPLVTCGDATLLQRPLFPRLVALASGQISLSPVCSTGLRPVQPILLELGSRELISNLPTTCWLLSCRPRSLFRNPAANAPDIAHGRCVTATHFPEQGSGDFCVCFSTWSRQVGDLVLTGVDTNPDEIRGSSGTEVVAFSRRPCLVQRAWKPTFLNISTR